MKKINCGGFYIDENDFNINGEGKLSLNPDAVGASSLSDLSDVDINESSILYGDNLLRFNTEKEKWENVRPDMALFGGYVGDSGVLAVSDVGNFVYYPFIGFGSDTTFGQSFELIISAAIQAGHFSTEMNNADLRGLVTTACTRIGYNVPVYLVLVDPNGDIKYTLVLSGANNDTAVFSGVVSAFAGAGIKFYRITMVAFAANAALTATLAVKAEELTDLEISLD